MNLTRLSLARTVFCSVLLSAACVVGAKDTGTDTSATIEKDIQTVVVNADGSFVLHYDFTLLINEQRAVASGAQRNISYNRTLESLTITEAYTQKPDGRRVKVQPDQIKDQQEARSAGAPIFQDTRVTAVIYPEVAVGDRVVLQFTKTRTTPLFPGHFEDIHIPSFADIKRFELIYDMPDSLPLYADAQGFTASVSVPAPGRKRYQWSFVPAERQRIERGSVAYPDYGLHLAVSTFADFIAFAKAYDQRAHDATAATARIREIALRTTAGLADPREKALALSNWVRRNIRYVAVYIGPGGVVPHAAESVLTNLYGDCKDHVALLEALLAAVEIDSTPALINLGTSYRLMKVPTLGVMNHVITYVPSLNLYLDSTADSIAAGFLPVSDLDKPVLLTKTGKIDRTPSNQPSRIVNRSDYRIRADGAADFSHSATITGWPAETTRYIMRSLKPADHAQVVERMLQQRGQKGTGTLELGNLAGRGDEYKMLIKGTSDNLINLPGPVGISANATFSNDIAQMVGSMNTEKERSQPYICIARGFDEETHFTLPPEISVLALPKPTKLRDANFDFSSSYERQANTIILKRSLNFQHAGAVCSPEEYKTMQPALEQIVKDLRSQVIVQAQ